MHYLILDAYPTPNGELIEQYFGAYVGCWVKPSLANTIEQAYSHAKEELEQNTEWRVVGLEEHCKVDDKTYLSPEKPGYQYYQQCLIDGFVACIHTCPHEVIQTLDEPDGFQMTIMQAAQYLAQEGATTLYSEAQNQWANGVSPNGENFVPIWPGAEPPKHYFKDWVDYSIDEQPIDHLLSNLVEIHKIEHCVGLGTNMGTLTTVHPLALRGAINEFL